MVRYAGLDHPGFETWQLALTVALSVAACMTIAATVGGGVPMLLQRAGIDPAVATGPFVTTAVDIIGILAYFLIARALLGI
jgi:magnesium transporter